MQSRTESLVETSINVATGFIISYSFWKFVLVGWIKSGYITIDDNLIITCLFTVLAVARGYIWRRFFNAEVHKIVHRWLHGKRKEGTA